MREIRGPRTSKLRANRRPLKQDPPQHQLSTFTSTLTRQNKKIKKNKKNKHTHISTHTHTDKKKKKKPSRAVAFWVIHESHLKRHQKHPSHSFYPFFPHFRLSNIFCPIFKFGNSFFFLRRIVSLLFTLTPFVL